MGNMIFEDKKGAYALLDQAARKIPEDGFADLRRFRRDFPDRPLPNVYVTSLRGDGRRGPYHYCSGHYGAIIQMNLAQVAGEKRVPCKDCFVWDF